MSTTSYYSGGVGTLASAREREILDRYLRPIVERFEVKIRRNAFFFLYPPAPGEAFESVRYYGLKNGDAGSPTPPDGDVKRISDLVTESYASLFAGLPEGAEIGFERFPGFLNELIRGAERIFGGDRSLAFNALWHVARDILSKESVRIRPEEGVARSSTQILLAHAFDMANTDFVDGPPAALRLRRYPDPEFCKWFVRVRDKEKFLTNSHFSHSDEPGPEPDCTLLVATEYLTRPGYLTGRRTRNAGETSPTPKGTFLPFAAECLFALKRDELMGKTLPQLEAFLRALRQIHLPIAAMGQYRGSVCWISHEEFREPLERARLVREVDRHFQGILSEFFSLAMLDVYESMIEGTLRLVHERDETSEQFEKRFYTQLALALGYLVGSRKVEFIRRNKPPRERVATYSAGEVIIEPATGNAHDDAPGDARFITVDDPGTAEGDNTVVTFHLNQADGDLKAEAKCSAVSLLASTLRCDEIRCHAYFITENHRLRDRDPIISDLIVRQVRQYHNDIEAQRNRISSLFTHSMTNMFRELDIEQSTKRLSEITGRIAGQLEQDEKKSLKRLVTKLSRIGTINRRLQRQCSLWKMADKGEIDADWLGDASVTRKGLEAWRQACRKMIHSMAFIYEELISEKNHKGKASGGPVELVVYEIEPESRVPRRVRNLTNPGILGEVGWIDFELPPFRREHADEGFLMITMGLEEIVRNPLKLFDSDENRPKILKKYGALFLIYEVTIEPEHDPVEVVTRVWNPLLGAFSLQRSSRSLKMIEEDMRGFQGFTRFGEQKVVKASELSFKMPGAIRDKGPGGKHDLDLICSEFAVRPGLIFDTPSPP